MEKLELLKRDLQKLNNADDELLTSLLESSASFIKREGIIDDGSLEYTMIQVQYAAYLFRKRSAPETNMPRFIRWEMNNLLFSQKSK